MPPTRYLMFRGCRFALMLMQRWIAPTRHVCRREKEQRRRKGQFYLTVRSAAAWSGLLTSLEKDRPEEDASCCDSDKALRERQDDLPPFDHCKLMAQQWKENRVFSSSGESFNHVPSTDGSGSDPLGKVR